MTNYELLDIAGRLVMAIDNCTDWFLLSREQRDPEKRDIYDAIYKAKCRSFRRVLEDAYERFNR